MSGSRKREDFVSLKNATCFYEALGNLGGLPDGTSQVDGLFHYTNTNVLNAILNSGTFRASNLFYLNDEIEYKRGVDILKSIFDGDEQIKNYIKAIEEFDGKSWGGIFSISYSNQADVLQQWITYAKESGVCIELNKDIVWDAKSDELYLGVKSNLGTLIRLKCKCFLKLAYETKLDEAKSELPQLDVNRIRLAFAEAIKKAEGVSATIDEAEIYEIWKQYDAEAKQFLQLLASYYKEERFRGEGEIRAAFLPIYKDKKSRTKISYFEQNNGVLRPYIDVSFLHKYEDKDEAYQIECPIKSILVGPSGTQQKVYNSIVHRLKYGDVRSWKYNEEQLGKILSEYIKECIKSNDIAPSSDYLGITEAIAYSWCKKNGYDFCVIKATEAEVEVQVLLFEDREVGEIKLSDEGKTIVKKYMEDNYLSSQGIWVKKSSLPYNF